MIAPQRLAGRGSRRETGPAAVARGAGRCSAVVAGLLALLASPTVAATVIVVDRTDDEPTADACTAAPGDCSLRGAITHVNATGSLTVAVPAGHYLLTIAGAGEDANATGDLDITVAADLVIEGEPGDPPVIEQTVGDRLLDVRQGFTSVTLRDLVLIGGDVAGDGGAIRSDDNPLVLERTALAEHTASGDGGCLSARDRGLTVIDSVFSDCSAQGAGGAIHLAGSPLSLGGDLIDGTRFFGNRAGISGGAIYVIFGEQVLVRDSSFRGNETIGTSAVGGALTAVGVRLVVQRSDFVDNAAAAPASPLGRGGALYLVRLGSLPETPTNADLDNVTFARNRARGSTQRGGAIHVQDSDLDLRQVTIDDSRGSFGDAIYLSEAPGHAARLGLRGSAIDGGCASSGAVTITSTRGNVESPPDGTSSTCNLDPTMGDAVVADLALRPPAINGGPAGVMTQAPLAASPVRGFVPSTLCLDEDARTAPRAFLFCDAGAHESSGAAPGPWLFADGFESGGTEAWSDQP